MFVNRKNKERVKFFLVFTMLVMVLGFLILPYNTYADNEKKVGIKNDYSVEKSLLIENEEIKNNVNDLKPKRKIELLDFDKNVVAEYIEFENELNEYVGYVIKDVKSGHIYDYSNEGNLFEGLLSKAGLTYEDLYGGKVYFVNPFEIYVELNDGKIIDLMPQSGNYPSEITEGQLEESFYERKVEFGKPIEPELKSFKISEPVLSRRGSFTPCTTGDFDDLKITDSKGRRVYPHDHCSPTAATTIMKYFSYIGKSSLSSAYSNNDVFAKFYIAMDTNGGVSGSKDSGIVRKNIAPAYTKVGIDLGAKPKESYTLRGTSSKTMIDALKAGKLLHVSVDLLETSEGGHSIAVVSYSNGYFRIADGWSSYFRNVSYSDMSVQQVVSVKY